MQSGNTYRFADSTFARNHGGFAEPETFAGKTLEPDPSPAMLLGNYLGNLTWQSG
jgi:hypothetical protein